MRTMKIFRLVIALLCLMPLLSACGANGLGPYSGLVEERMMLPAQFKAEDGSTYTANLEAIVVRPDDGAKHPLAVVNEGTAALLYDELRPDILLDQTREFARRGWVAVTFSRRGWGHSGGSYDESVTKCDTAEYLRVGRRAAEDIREVVRLMDEKPYVDASKVIVVGHTGGGTIAVTADPPPGLAAAVIFAGSESVLLRCPQKAANAAYSTYGRTSRIPTLWVYSENDHVTSEDLIRRTYKFFSESGGNGEFLLAPPFPIDGASIFSSQGIPVWTRYVDDFLEKHGLAPRSGG